MRLLPKHERSVVAVREVATVNVPVCTWSAWQGRGEVEIEAAPGVGRRVGGVGDVSSRAALSS